MTKLAIACVLAAIVVFTLVRWSMAADEAAAEPQTNITEMNGPLDTTMQTLGGEDVNLAEKYQDQVVMFVNVASKCGFTPQYVQLQELHDRYADQGLAIVGVPCNQFAFQEPGSAEQIADFCRKNYGVEFDMLAKVKVNGKNACPLYKYLTSKETDPEFAGKIGWNFEKFLLSRQGKVVKRFNSKVKPDAPEVIEAIEYELAQPAS